MMILLFSLYVKWSTVETYMVICHIETVAVGLNESMWVLSMSKTRLLARGIKASETCE